MYPSCDIAPRKEIPFQRIVLEYSVLGDESGLVGDVTAGVSAHNEVARGPIEGLAGVGKHAHVDAAVYRVERRVVGESRGVRTEDGADGAGSDRNGMLRFELKSSAELPFEKNYYINAGKTVCWFVQREKVRELEERGMPDYLAFDEEKLLFLK